MTTNAKRVAPQRALGAQSLEERARSGRARRERRGDPVRQPGSRSLDLGLLQRDRPRPRRDVEEHVHERLAGAGGGELHLVHAALEQERRDRAAVRARHDEQDASALGVDLPGGELAGAAGEAPDLPAEERDRLRIVAQLEAVDLGLERGVEPVTERRERHDEP